MYPTSQGQDCSHFEFECANDGQPMTFPQCVALYDTCDGIEHCSDGSDERQCPQRASSQGKEAVVSMTFRRSVVRKKKDKLVIKEFQPTCRGIILYIFVMRVMFSPDNLVTKLRLLDISD